MAGISLQLLAVLGLCQTRHNGLHLGDTAEVSQAGPRGVGGGQAAWSEKGGVEGGGPLPFLVWFSLQEQNCIWPHSGQLIRPGVSFVYASAA